MITGRQLRRAREASGCRSSQSTSHAVMICAATGGVATVRAPASVFPGRHGGAETDTRRDWQRWRDALKAAGVPLVPLHGARASAASLLMEMGVPDRVIADILGHAQVQVTQRHYLRSDDRQRREALEKAAGQLL